MQANANKPFGGQVAPMAALGQNDQIKALVKSERKTRKKGKKAIKVQEFFEISNVDEDKDTALANAETEEPQFKRSSSRVSESQSVNLTSEKSRKRGEDEQSQVDE